MAATMAPSPARATLAVEGMNCASCVSHVQEAAAHLAGVSEVNVNLARGRALVEYDPAQTDVSTIAAAITAAGYAAEPAENQKKTSPHQAAAEAWLRRARAGFLLWLPMEVAHWVLGAMSLHIHWLHLTMDWLGLLTSTLAMVYVGRAFYQGAWAALRRFTSNMDTLIALGATVAYGYSLVAMAGVLAGIWSHPPAYYFVEASGLLALISLGHWLEARARDSAGSAIGELLTLTPTTALKLDGDAPSEVALSEVELGDRLLVRPGDRIPTDGDVEEGHSAVDESMITGEPIPPTRTVGDQVIGGTLNLDGRLIIKATKVGSETALARILQLVESAQAAKPPVQKLADQIAAVFVPVVLMIAVATGIGWYFYGHGHGWLLTVTLARLANAVCSVLIIACPCALGLALPTALMVGTSLGARRGILIHDLDALQRASSIKTVVLDKTGTVTEGHPTVQNILPVHGVGIDELLALAASAEQSSSHPLARAIVAAASEHRLPLEKVTELTSDAGFGVTAQVGGRKLLVGNEALLARNGLNYTDGEAESGPVVYVAQKQADLWSLLGVLRFSDAVKADSASAIDELQKMGFKTFLLTGDGLAAAQAVAAQVGIGMEQIKARVTPGEKAAVIRQLQKSGPVAMVGDGVNDAAALAAADLGIAIGSGSDIAKEAGGIVLMNSNLMDVVAALRLSRFTMRTIRRNLVFAFMYNVLAIPLAAFGLLNPLIAAAAMALSDVTVIGSALLLRRARLGPPTPTAQI